MQDLLLEHPFMLGIGGSAVVALALFIWLQTAKPAAMYAAVAIAAVTVVLVLLSLQVETDRERLRRILDEVAVALERNDRETVYSYIHPNAVDSVQRAKSELPQYDFSEARVTRVKEIRLTGPTTAVAEFNVFVEVTVQGQRFRVPRFVKIYFMKSNDQWLVSDYEHFEPTAGFRNTDFDNVNR